MHLPDATGEDSPMVWWEEENSESEIQVGDWEAGIAADHVSVNSENASATENSSDPLDFPPLPNPLKALPDSLPELLVISRKAGATLDHVTSWRAVTKFAHTHWLADAPTNSPDVIGEFHALRHAVADQLELVEEATAARAEWLRWATEANIRPAILHARSYGAFAEAEAFIDANPGDAITGRRPEDSEIPELISLTKDIVATTPQPGEAYYYLVSAAVAGAAASLARRAEIAGQLSEWSARWAPKRSSFDDRKLLEAQLAHSRGELRRAARIAASVAAAPQSEPVTTTIEARQFLAFLSLEAGEEAEAIRQLRPIVQAGLDAGLTVAVLRSVRLLCALLNAHGDFAESAEFARRALASAEGMPVNPITMDIQLVLARSLLDADEVDEALRFAEPVAHWSAFTADEERTDAAFSIASTAAGLGNNPAGRQSCSSSTASTLNATAIPRALPRPTVRLRVLSFMSLTWSFPKRAPNSPPRSSLRTLPPPLTTRSARLRTFCCVLRSSSPTTGHSPTGTTMPPTSSTPLAATLWPSTMWKPPRRATCSPAMARKPPARCWRGFATVSTRVIPTEPPPMLGASKSFCPATCGKAILFSMPLTSSSFSRLTTNTSAPPTSVLAVTQSRVLGHDYFW
ncbi:lipopolysaccharide assembly protein LapB [Corynebacterium sp. HMSC074C04]|uniref:tetratricopeptide repeat protein n=1 Tax=Corynebacterium sp. HMSC074C04 TaxID=1739514 RepID=UPI001FEEE2D3|nr:hypothetical protein [Corynebacterium sp. HMSC074C04]